MKIDRSEAWHEWLPPVVLMAAAFLVFANTFGHTWNYDDFPVIVENPDVQSWRAFLADSYPGRPLRELTFLLDHFFFGLNPAGWHIQNIFWHALNAGLLFILVRRLGGEAVVAWAASLLFLVHPIQVEVVANISHRKDSLVLAFSLLSVLAYLKAFAAERRSGLWLGGAFGMAFVALQAKQSAVVLPLIFLACELACVPRERRFLLRYPVLWAAAAVAGAGGAAIWFFQFGGEAGFQRGISDLLFLKANYFASVTIDVYYRMVLKSWTFMVLKFLWPAGLALEYTYPVPSSWSDPSVMAAVVAAAAYLCALWHSASRSPMVFFALAWIGAFWLPVSNLWPLAYLSADRYLYAPSAGLFILAALLLSRVFKKPVITTASVLLVAIPLSFLTWRQNQVWQTPETLWTRAYEVSPESAFALNNMGNIFLLKGELLPAKDFYARAAQVNPGNPTAHYNLGLIHEQVGSVDQALEHYRRFLAINDFTFRQQADELRRHLRTRYGVDVSPGEREQGRTSGE